jgi:dipeptidyl aminopeptidase/acylaminoacyl peptidase
MHAARNVALFAICVSILFSLARVDADELLYQLPPKVIADLVDTPPTPLPSLPYDKHIMMLLEQPTLPSIVEISQPELRLAGIRINPRNNGLSREGYYAKLHVYDYKNKDASPKLVQGFPQGARIGHFSWSPDGKSAVATVHGDKEISLWLIDPSTYSAKKLIDKPVNGAFYSSYTWVSDGSLVVSLVPDERGEAPSKDAVPKGPLVQENMGRKRPARTNPDLLKDPHDERLFEYHMKSQLARVDLTGKIEKLGEPDLYSRIDASPDGKHLLVVTVHRPYSYKVAYSRFPQKVQVWSLPSGAPEKQLSDNPLMEEVPIDFAAVPTGPRAYSWRDDADATVKWVEARDGGDPKAKADIRDEVFMLPAPFDAQPTRLAQLSLRYGGITWGTGQLALLNEWWWSDRKTRTFIIAPDDVSKKPRVLWDRSSEDRYGDPGEPVLDTTARATVLLHRTNKGNLLLDGNGASPEGDRPFLDELDLEKLTTKRMWRSQAPNYEYVAKVLDQAGNQVLTRRESVSEPPQYYLKNFSSKFERRITNFPNPNPSLAKVEKKLLQYQRADGVKLSGMLYVPPGFVKGESKPLPLLMWAYPTEYKSKDAAGQIDGSPYRFVRVSFMGPLFALLLNVAVLDDPKFPIVGEGKIEPNDSYVEQLVAGAEAAVKEVVNIGVADKDRIAIGGHSYGAFTTVNLLAHTNFFRAGIARSGAFNRTLTPFGFQSEERNFWQASNVYNTMSPFSHADKIDEPLLLIHGEVDDNPGTYPVQSERLFEAIKGLGGTVRWVVLPAETHGYRAKESILHMFYEMTQWLEKYVINAPKRG